MSSTVLNKNGDSGQSSLVPDFRGNAFCFSPFHILLAIWMFYIAFIMWRSDPSIAGVGQWYRIKLKSSAQQRKQLQNELRAYRRGNNLCQIFGRY
jgi:hypothetical protein